MSSGKEQEHYMKKKLQSFLAELIRAGTVKGFQYMALYLRGREELVISMVNEPVSPDNSYGSENPSPLASSFAASNMKSLAQSFNSGNLPYDKRSLMLSARTQKSLSGYADIDVGLPPASPSDKEIAISEENSTLFLLAGYARYMCPYVWVRSNHRRLVKLTGEEDKDRDNPLKLKTTDKWKDGDIKVYDILAELVKLCTYPPPINPFAVDFNFFDTLPHHEKLLSTGAMINFLQKVVITKREPRVYTAKVLEDLQKITKIHFETLQALSTGNHLPVYTQYLEEQQKQQQEQQHQQQQQMAKQTRISSHRKYNQCKRQEDFSSRYRTAMF